MSRNAESRFAINPTNIDISRSRFGRHASVKTTFNVGDLIPFYVDEVLPGDSFSIDTSKVVRMQTLVAPIMDNIYLDTYWFFVPNRLVWSHWKELMGENTQSAWIPSAQYSVPQITSPASTGWTKGSIADYFGIPTGVTGLSVNALPFRGLALIVNEWFRDQNLTDPLYIPVDDSTVAGTNGTNYRADVAKGGMPFKAAKYHDYFTSALPSPQKGPDVKIPLGLDAPVITGAAEHNLYTPGEATPSSMIFRTPGASGLSDAWNTMSIKRSTSDTKMGDLWALTATDGLSGAKIVLPSNLYADLSSATGQTISALRLAFQIQKMFEKDARGGKKCKNYCLHVKKIAEKNWKAA